MNRIFFSLLLAIASLDAHAQSSLPPCQETIPSDKWTDCFGTYFFPDGTQYVGEFREGKQNGKGAEFNRNGNVNRHGIWRNGQLMTVFAGSPDFKPASGPFVARQPSSSSDSRIYRDLPRIRSVVSKDNPDQIIYYVPLRFFSPKLANYSQACQFELKLNGKPFEKYTLEAPYEFPLLVDRNFTTDVQFEWDNKVTFSSSLMTQLVTGVPICIGAGHIYLSEVYASEWTQLEQTYNKSQPESAYCLRAGMAFKGLPYFLERREDGTSYPSINHPTAQEVISRCQDLVQKNKLSKNVECTIGQRETRCDSDWYEERDNRYVKLAGLQTAIEKSLAGKKVAVMTFETAAAKAAYTQRIAQEEAARRERADEEAKRQRWLASPEGQRYLAEQEAQAKKAEQEQKRREAVEKARMAQEFPYYAVISCGFQGNHINILACFGGRVGTELELRNGDDYGLYKVYDIGTLGSETSQGMIINLRRTFELKAQNSNETLILGVKIYQRSTDKVLFQKQVARFGVIRISN